MASCWLHWNQCHKDYSHRVVVVLMSCNARMDGVLEVVGQGEGAHDVAVGVHHIGRNRPVVRVTSLGENV